MNANEDVLIYPENKILAFEYGPATNSTDNLIRVVNKLSKSICYKVATTRRVSYVVFPSTNIIEPNSEASIKITLKNLGDENAKAVEAKFRLQWTVYNEEV